MTLHDELLSFQIRETVFLTSDRAGIGELKELELLPDVEIIENSQEISITGCLQLYGKYEPARSAQTEEAGGADTLLSAMKFTPFQLEEAQQAGSYGESEHDLAHRIPLNITIPMSRIKEIGEIYAIVDSLDYELKTPVQLQIHAVLKLSGIVLKEQTEADAAPQEVWDFVHLAGQDEQQEAEPVSLDDIERKLALLEQEVELRRRQEQAVPPPYLAEDVAEAEPQDAGFAQPALGEPTPPELAAKQGESAGQQDERGRVPDEVPPRDATGKLIDFRTYQRGSADAGKQPAEGLAAQPAAAWFADSRREAGKPADHSVSQPAAEQATPEGENASSAEAAAQAQPAAGEAAKGGAKAGKAASETVPPASSRADEPTRAAAGKQTAADSPQLTAADSPATEPVEEEPAATAASAELAEQPAAADAAAEQAEPMDQPAAATTESESASAAPDSSQREFKVAISGKPSKEQAESLNLTAIFSNARRAASEQEAAQQESAAKAAEQEDGKKSSGWEAVGNLTSFVRGEAETFSKLKICIIQRDETIQEIADRYSLSVSRILEVNNLSSERLVEGQVLYIPQ